MNYYDLSNEQRKATGIDYDLLACLEYNPQGFIAENIAKVMAVFEGENDGDDWRWILQLKDGRIVFLKGGCDYTGWDCQSWASSEFSDTPENAAEKEEDVVVRNNLLVQLSDKKAQTWREKMDMEMGL